MHGATHTHQKSCMKPEYFLSLNLPAVVQTMAEGQLLVGSLAVVLWDGRHMAFVGGTVVHEGEGEGHGDHCMGP